MEGAYINVIERVLKSEQDSAGPNWDLLEPLKVWRETFIEYGTRNPVWFLNPTGFRKIFVSKTQLFQNITVSINSKDSFRGKLSSSWLHKKFKKTFFLTPASLLLPTLWFFLIERKSKMLIFTIYILKLFHKFKVHRFIYKLGCNFFLTKWIIFTHKIILKSNNVTSTVPQS